MSTTAEYASDPPHYSPYLETLTGPEVGDPPDEQVWALDWEQPDATNRPNYWRLTQVQDPAGHTVEYVYNFHADGDGTVDDLTLVTGIVEMDPDGTGSAAESTTTIDYYWSDDPNAKGQLKTVTDDNEVEHHFKYDDLGYQTQMWEGTPLDIPGPDVYRVIIGPTCSDAAGRPMQHCHHYDDCFDASACPEVIFDNNNNMTDSICQVITAPYQPYPIRLGNPPSAWIEPLQTCSTANEYDALDRPTGLNGCYDDPDVTADSGSRTADMTYDALSRLLTLSVASTEHRGSGLLELTQTWDYDD